MPYAPIDSYAMIGNMHTAALVGEDGSIDWLCLPQFDSPSVFASILDDRKGGRFRICAIGSVGGGEGEKGPEESGERERGVESRHFYWPDTNVLMTRFRSSEAVGEILDFMPLRTHEHEHGIPELVRLVKTEYGTMRYRLECFPAFDYARAGHEVERTPAGVAFRSTKGGGSGGGGGGTLWLSSTVPLEIREDQAGNGPGVFAEFMLGPGECASIALWYDRKDGNNNRGRAVTVREAEELLHDTISFWRRWLKRCTYKGRWEEMVKRSALALKLMTFDPTGAIVAAPTTSLPEHIGGGRNWDYRYTWIRDAAFTVYALMRIGFTEEAAKFMDWLHQRCHEIKEGGGKGGGEGMLLPMYTIDGGHEMPEMELNHLEGYKKSGPVRIGNAAYKQLQLDVVGELMDAAYLHNKHHSPLSYDLWLELRKLLNWTCRNWTRKDEGVWEVRGNPQHFVYSKLMCWVALDRGIRLSQQRAFPGEITYWRKHRDRIYEEIMNKGWDPKAGAFMQYYGSEGLDAANLIMPLVFFISPSDPRMTATLDAIDKPMPAGGLVTDFLVHRYDYTKTDDGLNEPEGGFNMCTFWLIEALARAGRIEPKYLERARLLFDRAMGVASPVGLFAEQTGRYAEALGNYPQGLTHLSFISAAYNLDRVLNETGRA
jgi:GH15 family glucan-1,4-alpha-glucosidase